MIGENTYFTGTNLLHCTQMGEDIKTCQAAGKKILLSLGGAAGSYGFTSDSQAETFADTLWNLFGGGTSDTRPFDDAVVDGFDLDIEGGSSTGYVAFVNRMRQHYASDSSKSYYISAAPQCPLPDAYLNTVLTGAHVDFIFVQFYNNYCTFIYLKRSDVGGINQYVSGATTNFNFAAWDTFAKTQSYNTAAKVYLGVPASSSAAGTGYVDITTLGSAAEYLQSTYSSFGGIMMWYVLNPSSSNQRDCSQAWGNIVSGNVNYAQAAKVYLASDAAVVISSSTSATSPHTPPTTSAKPTSLTLASTTGSLLNPGKVATSCPAGCVPISYSTTISIIPTPITSTKSTTAASGCPVAGGSCSSGAMACSGYYYGQCANGVWVMRKCADGLACFESNGVVYCDWASNGIITDCSGTSSSKVKRDGQDYGVAFADGSSGDNASVSVDGSSTEAMSTEVFSTVTSATTASDSSAVSTSGGSDNSATATEVSTTSTSSKVYTATETATTYVDIYAEITEDASFASATTTPTSASTSGLDSVEITGVPYVYNSSTISPILFQNITYTNVTSSNTASSSMTSDIPISDVTSHGPTPPTNVTLAIQPLNTTHFVAVLQAATLNNTPILTDWSFSFNSEYQIVGADRGNLTGGQDGSYTITSIPIQEPDRSMAIIVKLWGVYDSSTAEGLVGINGDNGMTAVNGSFSMIKRAIRMGFGL